MLQHFSIKRVIIQWMVGDVPGAVEGVASIVTLVVEVILVPVLPRHRCPDVALGVRPDAVSS